MRVALARLFVTLALWVLPDGYPVQTIALLHVQDKLRQ